MDFNTIENYKYCKEIVDNVRSLLYYSHIPVIVVSLILGIFVFFKSKKSLIGKVLFWLTITFSLWSALDLIIWIYFYKNSLVMFSWSLLGFLDVLFFILSLYFVYAFIEGRDISFGKKIIFGLILLPAILLTPTRFNLSGFNLQECISVENEYFLNYLFVSEILISLWIVILLIRAYIKADKTFRGQIIFLGIGIFFFLASFFFMGYLADYLENFYYELYGLFGMIFFMGMLAYLIVRFKAFNIKLLKAQALMVTLAVLISALFFYVSEVGGKIIILINLALAVGFGYMLVKSVKKEVEQKEELEVAYVKLEELDKAKAEFTSLANHQLKHAPTSIKSLLGMFLDGDYGEVPDNQLVALKNINMANERQIHLADDLLQIIKMESNKVQLDFQKQHIEDVCQGVYDNIAATAKEKNLELNYEKPDQPLPEVLFDKSKVFEAIFNFVDNAVKYTPKGSITIKTEFAPSSNYKPQNSDDVDKKSINGSVVRVTVSDTGNGISKEKIGHLFAKFSRQDTAKLNSGGTGLGLYMVKLMIEAHGGRTWAESDGEGKGSRFIMELPIETPKEILEQNESKK